MYFSWDISRMSRVFFFSWTKTNESTTLFRESVLKSIFRGICFMRTYQRKRSLFPDSDWMLGCCWCEAHGFMKLISNFLVDFSLSSIEIFVSNPPCYVMHELSTRYKSNRTSIDVVISASHETKKNTTLHSVLDVQWLLFVVGTSVLFPLRLAHSTKKMTSLALDFHFDDWGVTQLLIQYISH